MYVNRPVSRGVSGESSNKVMIIQHSEEYLGGKDLPIFDTPELKSQSVVAYGEEQIDQPHLSLENGLKYPHPFGELSDLIIETSRGMEDQSLSEIPKNKGQSVMKIASLIAAPDGSRAVDVVDLAAEDELGLKGLS